MDDDSDFARIKLRRRLVVDKEILEPVEYQESEEDEENQQLKRSSIWDCLFCWHSVFINKLLGMVEKSSGINRQFLLLYSGYGISCVGDRLWTFAIVFILERLGGMRLVCINQFIDAISAMVLSGYLGNWLDRHDRRFGTLTVLAVNNISVAISALMLFICLGIGSFNSLVYGICIGLSILFCAISKCASGAEKFSFTKDWIVVLSRRDGTEVLSKKNAMMTVIDQTSSVVAPIITSYSLTFLGYKGACGFFVAVNLVFWVIERSLLTKVYNEVGELHVRERDRGLDSDMREEIDLLTHRKNIPLWKRLGKMFHAYFRQSVFPAAFGLALLYMTVLGFDGLAISYGKSQKMPDEIIGWFRSAGSVLGIAGAASYTTAERRFGIRKAGLIGLLFQQIFLYLCVISIFLPGSPFDPSSYWRETTFESWRSRFIGAFYSPSTEKSTINAQNITFSPNSQTVTSIDWSTLTIGNQQLTSVFVFFMGLTLARLGLWMADLSITQIMQENVPEEERGTVFGVQTACCQLFSVGKDLLVIVFPDPRTFGWLIMMSVFFVILGFMNYVYYLFKTRSHISSKSTSLSTTHHSSSLLLNGKDMKSLKTSQELKPLTKSNNYQ